MNQLVHPDPRAKEEPLKLCTKVKGWIRKSIPSPWTGPKKAGFVASSRAALGQAIKEIQSVGVLRTHQGSVA